MADKTIIKQQPFVKIIIQSKNSSSPKFTRINLEDGMTYEDLLEVVGIKEDIPIAEYCFYRKDGSELRRLGMKDLVLPTEQTGTIHLKTVPLKITVRHLGSAFEVEANPQDTPNDLRRKFAISSDRDIDGVPLSFAGRKMGEDDTLESVGLVEAHMEKIKADDLEGEPVVVSGALRIFVEDQSIKNGRALEVFPFNTVEEVMQRYCDEEGRRYLLGSTLSLEDKELEDYRKIADFERRLGDEVPVVYRSARFSVVVKEEGGEELGTEGGGERVQSVEDHWTVSKLREQYSARQDVRPLSEKDGFFLNQNALDLEVMIYRLKLGEGDVLHVLRAPVEQFNLYTCGDCGAELKLKPRDVVRCKYCFFRIVYKKRTARICQYNCR